METIYFKFLRFPKFIFITKHFITIIVAITSSQNIVDQIHYHDYSPNDEEE